MDVEQHRQHYGFGHTALPSLVFSDPAWLLGVLNGPDAGALLHELWRRVGTRVEANQLRDPDGLSSHVSIDDHEVVAMVTFPQPRHTTECHFAALIARFAQPGARDFQRIVDVRYFTLELGTDISKPQDPRCTFFCEWTRGGMHRNHGLGPMPPSVDAFRELITRKIHHERTLGVA